MPAVNTESFFLSVCVGEAVGGEIGTVLRWVTALLCRLGCCEKACGKCESSQGAGSARPQEALQNHCGWPC